LTGIGLRTLMRQRRVVLDHPVCPQPAEERAQLGDAGHPGRLGQAALGLAPEQLDDGRGDLRRVGDAALTAPGHEGVQPGLSPDQVFGSRSHP
jgi:hypothetical protein